MPSNQAAPLYGDASRKRRFKENTTQRNAIKEEINQKHRRIEMLREAFVEVPPPASERPTAALSSRFATNPMKRPAGNAGIMRAPSQLAAEAAKLVANV